MLLIQKRNSMVNSDPIYGVNMAKKIEHWATERLQPYEKNARLHNSDQVGQIAQSIVEFGFLNPILVDTNDGIIAGHGRLEAAKELKLKEVPVVVLDHLSDKQRKAYIIVDNKLALNASWDVDVLSEEIAELEQADFDINLLGFTPEEIEAFNDDGWASDIEDPTKDGEHMDAIKAKIVVELDGTYKQEIEDVIKKYCDEHVISIEIK